MREGKLTREEAGVHPQRSIITRALGMEPDIEVDSWELIPYRGDRLLLCSDGLTNELSDDRIAATLRQVADPQEAARDLVRQARAEGGGDNITVVVVDVVDDEGRAEEASAALARDEVLAGARGPANDPPTTQMSRSPSPPPRRTSPGPGPWSTATPGRARRPALRPRRHRWPSPSGSPGGWPGSSSCWWRWCWGRWPPSAGTPAAPTTWASPATRSPSTRAVPTGCCGSSRRCGSASPSPGPRCPPSTWPTWRRARRSTPRPPPTATSPTCGTSTWRRSGPGSPRRPRRRPPPPTTPAQAPPP